jgi:hypothetical protein
MHPKDARLRVTTNAPALTDDEWVRVQTDLHNTWISAQTAREPMDENLAAWSAIYELETEDVNDPWVGAANLIPPIAPAELDAMKANVAAQVFVPRLIIVTAADDDPETARKASKYERYLNSELHRLRSNGKTPIQELKTVLHLGLRDGGGPCDVLFTERKEPKMIVSLENKIVDDDIVLDDSGEPEKERVVTMVEEEIREVSFVPRLLKEWYLQPDESTSIASAPANSSVLWMMESEMREKVAEGTFKEEAVERVLVRLNSGTTDVASDPTGAYDKDAGGQIQVGQGQGSITSEFFRNRGPARIVRTCSSQFDMNRDKKPEKNIFWHHPDYPEMLGWTEYEYLAGQWFTFCFAPFPRPDRVYGYSLIERLADIIADAAAGRNQRRNYIDLALMPILLERDGDQIRDKDRAFYPGARWSVENPGTGPTASLSWFTVPSLPPDSFADEGRLDVYVAKLTGQNAPALGAQSSGRRSATESRQQMLATQMRSNDVAWEYRAFLHAVVQFWHKLLKQYLGSTGKTSTTYVPTAVARASSQPGQEPVKAGPLTIDAEILNAHFNITISGMADPIDAPNRRQEIMAALGVVFQAFPWIPADPELAYSWAEQFVETFQWASVERFIGTMDQARARKEAIAQQQAALPPGGPQPAVNGQATPAGATP